MKTLRASGMADTMSYKWPILNLLRQREQHNEIQSPNEEREPNGKQNKSPAPNPKHLYTHKSIQIYIFFVVLYIAKNFFYYSPGKAA